MRIVCSGFLVRYPLGGFSWHHLQYLAGLQRMGHEVTYFEDHGWPRSCYDPRSDVMTADPSFGLGYLGELLDRYAPGMASCYLAEDGTTHGTSREELADLCRDCDAYINLSNINWIPELELCRRRILVDTDPVFTQIRAHGAGGAFDRYHARFTYGENVGRADCAMPTGGVSWLPTRQPVVLDLWPGAPPEAEGSITTIMNWSAYGEHEHEGRVYGQKNREMEPYFGLPKRVGAKMAIALNGPPEVRRRLEAGGWGLIDPREATRTPESYQRFIAASRAEFSVAKHGYVSTRSGWFSERTCAYLAMGRPAVVQDTGFSRLLPCGSGLLCFRDEAGARRAVAELHRDYASHCARARELVSTYFDSEQVLGALLARAL